MKSSSSSSSFEEYPLQVRHKQDWGRGFIFLLPQTAALPKSDASRPRVFVTGTGARPVGIGLLQAAWVKLNRLRTGIGQFHSSMHKWGLASSPNCE